jgi:P4 family phage/plasmid primase-like protien
MPSTPPYWKAQLDPEWMRRRLRDALAGCWYVSSHTEKGQRVYDGLKWWNPDDRNLTQVENALADIAATAAGGSGVGACELCDLYGRQHNAYRGDRLVLVRNGVLDVTTGRLVDATALWFDLTRIEAVYNHRDPIDGAAQWMSVLRTQWPDDPGSIGLLQQWFGYVISRRLDLQKFLWIYGESGTAKSLIAAVLEALIGNVTELGLDALNTPFGLQAAYEAGATLTVMSDVRFGSRDSSLAVARLLSIVGDDMVDIPRKYKAAIKDRLSVRFHGTSNELPKLSDHTDALIDRMLILETTRVFPRGGPDTDEGLPARIIADELGLVLRWAVEGLRRLDTAGGRFDKPARAEEMRTETAHALSNVGAFRNECATVVAAEDHKHTAGGCGCVCVDAGALFRVWGKWAADNKSGERMSKAAFLRALKSLGGGVRPGQLLNGQRVVWGIEKAHTVYLDRDRFGLEVARIASTDPDVDGDPAGDDPFTPCRAQHPGAS